MQVSSEAKPYDDINITPMLDLAYVLLIIFIIMTTASVQGIHVQLPRTSSAESLTKPLIRSVTVTKEGKLTLDTQPVTVAELTAHLTADKAAKGDKLSVVVRADAKAPYEDIVGALDVIGKLNISPGLMTEVAK